MALTLEFRKATNNPMDDASPSGGAVTTTVVQGTSVGEIIPKGVYAPNGGSDTGPWYYSLYLKNTSATDTFYSPKLYVPNGILGFAATGILQVVSGSAADGNTKKLRVYSRATTGVGQVEEITLNGTTPVYGVQQHLAGTVYKCECRYTADGTLAPVVGPLTVSRGTDILRIPSPIMLYDSSTLSCDFGTGEYLVAGATALNTNQQVTNRLTAPTGVSAFSLPTSLENGMAAPDDLGPGDHWQIWIRWLGKSGTLRTSRSRLILIVEGTD